MMDTMKPKTSESHAKLKRHKNNLRMISTP